MRKDQAQFLPCLKAEVSLREMMKPERNKRCLSVPFTEEVDPKNLDYDIVEWVKSRDYRPGQEIDDRTLPYLKTAVENIRMILTEGCKIMAYNSICVMSGWAGYQVIDPNGEIVWKEVIWRS